MAIEKIERAPLSTDEQALMGELAAFLSKHTPLEQAVLYLGPEAEDSQTLPATLVRALDVVATLLAQGDDVALVPLEKRLTTFEAAALLNVSRPFLITLLDRGVIPSTKTGAHRRVLVRDVLAYKEQRRTRGMHVLDDALAMVQQHGVYD